MAAICPSCSWTGSAMKVIDGGRCPDCKDPVRYDSKPLESRPSPTKMALADFNKRAAVALRTVAPDEESSFLSTVLDRVERGWSLSADQQTALMRVVLRFERQITDLAVVDYAIFHKRGY